MAEVTLGMFGNDLLKLNLIVYFEFYTFQQRIVFNIPPPILMEPFSACSSSVAVAFTGLGDGIVEIPEEFQAIFIIRVKLQLSFI